jgi:small conductance mechanosensitive channel
MASVREKLLFLVISLLAVFSSWLAMRSWLLTVLLANFEFVHFIDVAIVSGIGIVTVALLTKWMSRPLVEYVGPTQSNAVKLFFQLVGLAVIFFVVFSVTGINLVTTLVGVGFFGIIIGLAAQSVLGNLLSGIMLLASRPFNINDRIALITWQYGKFPPTLPHGWLEPSYTGIVKGIALTYTKILTDSQGMLKIPNALVTQSLILNLSHGRRGHAGTQFEVPIHVNPEELHKKLALELSKDRTFQGEEQSFEVTEISPSGYLLTINFSVEMGHEIEMKSLLLKALRVVLIDCCSEKDTPRRSE